MSDQVRLKEIRLKRGDEVNSVAAGIAHNHLTGHHGGGSDADYQCEECGFEVFEGVVLSGGAIAVRADAEPSTPSPTEETE